MIFVEVSGRRAHGECMGVAKKSSLSRQTLTLPARALELLNEMRGDAPKSVFLHRLLEKEAARRDRLDFYARATAAYTRKVSEETLALNAEFPVPES